MFALGFVGFIGCLLLIPVALFIVFGVLIAGESMESRYEEYMEKETEDYFEYLRELGQL